MSVCSIKRLPIFSKPIPNGNSLPQLDIFSSSSSDIPSTASWVGSVAAVPAESILADEGTLWLCELEEVPVLLEVSGVWWSAMLSRDVTGLLGTGDRFLFRAKSCDQRGPSRGVGREEGEGKVSEKTHKPCIFTIDLYSFGRWVFSFSLLDHKAGT